MFYMIFRPLEVGVRKKKKKKKERKKKKRKRWMLDVRTPLLVCDIITSILPLGGWISDETPFLIILTY